MARRRKHARGAKSTTLDSPYTDAMAMRHKGGRMKGRKKGRGKSRY